jgi:thiol-disulfide isomerase/thioredoxin
MRSVWIGPRPVSTVLVILSVTAMIFFSYSCNSPQTEVSEGLMAPALEIRDAVTGQIVNIEQYKGKVLFVNFWATWCPPCREEIPSIETLHRELSGDGRFALITILYKDTPKAAYDYMKANGYTFPVYADRDGTSSSRYKVTGVPETYLVDKKGILRKKVIGALDWNVADARAFINTLLIE